MFGGSQVELVKDGAGTLVAGREVFSGEGLMTDHEVSGHPGARLVAGCMFARQGPFNEKTGSWDIYPQFIHNPWAD